MKNTPRWDKSGCHGFDVYHAGLKMGVLANNPLQMIPEFCLNDEEVKRYMDRLIRRIIMAASRVAYHDRLWWAHVASEFFSAPLQSGLGHSLKSQTPLDWKNATGYYAHELRHGSSQHDFDKNTSR